MSDTTKTDPAQEPATAFNPGGYTVFSPAQRETIAKRLIERGCTLPCPRCANEEFSIDDALIKHVVFPPITNVAPVPRVTIPVIFETCTRCGFVAEHALGTLGFLTPTGFDF